MTGISGLQGSVPINPLQDTKTADGPASRTSVGQGSAGAAGAAGRPSGSADTSNSVGTPLKAPGDNNKSAGNLQTALDVVNDPDSSVEDKLKAILGSVRDPDALATLLIEFANMGRQNALDNRMAAREAARGDLEAQASETREAAQKQLASAIVTMVVSVVTAVVSGIGAAGASKGASDALKGGKQAADMATEAAQATKIATIAERSGASAAPQLQEIATNATSAAKDAAQAAQTAAGAAAQSTQNIQTVGSMVSALGQGAAKVADSQGTIDQAEGQEKAAKAQEEQGNADISKKFMDDLEELIKSAMRFLKEMQAAETDLMANMTRV